jgi:hypothetical protein
MIGTGFTAVAAGFSHSLAIKKDGSLWAWGDNRKGQLGDGTLTTRSSPVLVGTGFVSVAAGKTHSLAVKADGTLWAWGANDMGQLGSGVFIDVQAPQLVINDAVTGILDLDPAVSNSISTNAAPKVILAARKLGGLASLTLGSNVYFGAIDLGTLAAGTFSAGGPYKVYVAAIVPAGIAGVPSGIYLLEANRGWSYYGGGPLREYVSFLA